MSFKFTRTLHTPSSERFLIQGDSGEDTAGLDIHYLLDGSVVGSLIILDHAFATEPQIEAILRFIDESLLPMVSLNEKSLSFTVFKGDVIGQFENEK